MKIWKTLILILGLLFCSILLYFYFGFTGTPWGKIQQKKPMLSYLEKKYHTEFTIREIHYNPLGSGYYATASPKSNPNLEFDLSVSADELSGYADLYPVEFWKTKDADLIKDYLIKLFPKTDLLNFGLDRKLDEEVGPNIPTLNSVHYDMGYSGVLTIELKGDWFEKTDDERKTNLEKINQLSSYLQKNNLPVLVRVFYDSDDYLHRTAIYITQEGKVVE